MRLVQSVNTVLNRPLRSMPNITFTDEDFHQIDPNQDDPMVITVEVFDFTVMKTLVDQESSIDLLYERLFND